MDLYIYYKIDNDLYFDEYEIACSNSDSLYYESNINNNRYRMEYKNIGKVMKDNTVALIGRDDKKASDIFAADYTKQIEDLQQEIAEFENKKPTNKVFWFRNGYGVFEETDFDEEKYNDIDLD